MRKLLVTPSKSGYAVGVGNEARSVALDGGPSRTRRDFIGAVSLVDCSWNLPPDAFTYFQAFYRTATEMATEPFLIDLVLDEFSLLEYQSRFVPGSMRITGVSGMETSVAAQLETRPRPVNAVVDEGILMLYEAYEMGGALLLETLVHLVNVDMPGAL